MREFIRDINRASRSARLEASRELAATIGIALSVFVVGPLVFALLIVPSAGAAGSLFSSFSNSDIYMSAISLLSISIYSISKEYNIEGRDHFGFPHALTILLSAFVILVIALCVCTSRVIYEALNTMLTWRGTIAAIFGWLTFIVASIFAYAVLVLRNDMEHGSHRTRDDQEDFVREYEATRHGERQ